MYEWYVLRSLCLVQIVGNSIFHLRFSRGENHFLMISNSILSTSCPTTNNVFLLFSLQMNMKSMWLDMVEGVTTTIRQSFRCQGALLRLPPPQPRMLQREQWFSTHGDNSPWLTRLAKKHVFFIQIYEVKRTIRVAPKQSLMSHAAFLLILQWRSLQLRAISQLWADIGNVSRVARFHMPSV